MKDMLNNGLSVIDTMIEYYNTPLTLDNLKGIAKFEKANSIDFNSKLYLITIDDNGDVYYVVGLGYSLNNENTIQLSNNHKAFIKKEDALRYALYYLKATDIRKFKKLHTIDSCHTDFAILMAEGLERKFIYEESVLDIEDISYAVGEESIVKDFAISDDFFNKLGMSINKLFKKMKRVLGDPS